jgi:2-polyprenyl-3-methyl-5-hydroxy-6-metoxy-1,4-benzoquinol methylase
MKACRLCGSGDIAPAIDFGPMPIAHRMRSRRDEGEKRYPFREVLCRSCGLVQIAEPIDAEELYRDFNYCFSGWKPQPHMADELRLVLAETPGPNLIEVGANDGLFLGEARQAGFAPVLGIEPNKVATGFARDRGLEIVNEMLTPALARELAGQRGRFDVVALRQVLEHLTDIAGFFRSVEALLKPEGVLFVDVPDCRQGFATGDVTMMWEEHVNSFTEDTLEATLGRFGFGVVRRARYNFSGGTIAVVARRGAVKPRAFDLAAHVAEVERYEDRARAYRSRLRELIGHARAGGHAIVLYGAGNRANTLTNWADLGTLIDYAVDDQAERQGKFLPGTGIEVKASAALAAETRPVVCMLAVNTENDGPVTAKAMGLVRRQAIVFSLLSPKDIMAEVERASIQLGMKAA